MTQFRIKPHLFPFSAIILLIIVALGVCLFGVCLYFNPYLFTPTESIFTSYNWVVGNETQGSFYFGLSSKAFISTNYPVDVSVQFYPNMTDSNGTFNPNSASFFNTLNDSKYLGLIVFGSYAYPIEREGLGMALGILQGRMFLHNFDMGGWDVYGFEGSSTMIFPSEGDSYYFSVYCYNDSSPNSLISQVPICTMNLSSSLIEESYSSRAQLENASRNTGLELVSIGVSVGVAGIGIIVSVSRGEYAKKAKYDYDNEALDY
jgi:hypothetical protein